MYQNYLFLFKIKCSRSIINAFNLLKLLRIIVREKQNQLIKTFVHCFEQSLWTTTCSDTLRIRRSLEAFSSSRLYRFIFMQFLLKPAFQLFLSIFFLEEKKIFSSSLKNIPGTKIIIFQ